MQSSSIEWLDENERRVAQRAAHAALAKDDLLAFGSFVYPNFKDPKHIRALAWTLQRVESGHIKKLIITMPPQHGKSTLTSGIFPSWCIGRDPTRPIILTSYGAMLAEKFSAMNRDRIQDSPEWKMVFPDITINPNQANKSHWAVMGAETSLLASGIHGVATGFPAWGVLIDDPIKDHEEANSATVRESVWNTYLTVANTRLQQNGWIIIIMTRWHKDDLVGRVVASEQAREYKILHLPALSLGSEVDYTDMEETDRRRLFKTFPASAFPDPLGRPKDEPLWPEEKGYAFLTALRRLMKHLFSSMFQGIPTDPEGNKFLKSWFRPVTLAILEQIKAEKVEKVRSWDLAWSEKQAADYTAGLRGTLYKHNSDEGKELNFPRIFAVIEHAKRWQADWDVTGPRIADIAADDTRDYKVLVETVAIQHQAFKNIRQSDKMLLHTVIPITPKGDKEVRSKFPLLFAKVGGVYLLYPDEFTTPSWEEDLLSEITEFPHAENDDYFDSFTQMINYWEPHITQALSLLDRTTEWVTTFMRAVSKPKKNNRPPELTETSRGVAVDQLGWR